MVEVNIPTIGSVKNFFTLHSTKGKYGEGDTKEKFTYSQELVFFQCLVNALFAYIGENYH